MRCEKCGHNVNDLYEACKNCGAPITENSKKEDVTKYIKKGKHIDIEEMLEEKEQLSFSQTKKSVRKFLLFILLILILGLVFLTGLFVVELFSHEVFEKYEDIMEQSSLALIYLGKNDSIDAKCREYAENYGYDYLNIDVKNISYAKKKKLREDLNIYNLTSTLVVVQSGVPISHYSKIETEKELLESLQADNLVPDIIEDTAPILEKYEESSTSLEDTIIYLSTSYSENTDIKSEAIKNICIENNLIFAEIRGYLLSQKQLLKIMSEIGFTTIQEDLILYVQDGEIVQVLEANEKNEKGYFQLFLNHGIINVTSSENLLEIDENEFADMIQVKSKNVIFIGTDNDTYSERVKPIISKIAQQNNIIIYYLDATDNKEQISNMIKEIGYEDGLTITPFVLIVENNKYVDSIIGLADKDLYTNKFIEYGVIK